MKDEARRAIRLVSARGVRQPFTALRLLRELAGMSPPDARAALDRVAGGEPVTLEIATSLRAQSLLSRLARLGVASEDAPAAPPERRGLRRPR